MSPKMKTSSTKSNNSKSLKQKAVLIGVEFPNSGSAPLDVTLKELHSLAETAHYDPVSTISQKLIFEKRHAISICRFGTSQR